MITFSQIRSIINAKIRTKNSILLITPRIIADTLDAIICYIRDSGGGTGESEIDDSIVSTTKTWSSQKINSIPSGGGDSKLTEFKYIFADANDRVTIDGTMRKVVIARDVTLDALPMHPGMFGILIVKVDDEGGHKFSLATGNRGTVILNTLPRAETRLSWERYDNNVYWKAEILDPGIKPTQVPTIAIDDYYDTLDVYSQLGYSEILMSVNNGPWLPFPGPFSIGPVDRPAGYWRFKIKGLEPSRLESKVTYSLPTNSIKQGFTYDLPLTLS